MESTTARVGRASRISSELRVASCQLRGGSDFRLRIAEVKVPRGGIGHERNSTGRWAGRVSSCVTVSRELVTRGQRPRRALTSAGNMGSVPRQPFIGVSSCCWFSGPATVFGRRPQSGALIPPFHLRQSSARLCDLLVELSGGALNKSAVGPDCLLDSAQLLAYEGLVEVYDRVFRLH